MSSRSRERPLTSPLARRRASASSWRTRATACWPRRAATAPSRARASERRPLSRAASVRLRAAAARSLGLVQAPQADQQPGQEGVRLGGAGRPAVAQADGDALLPHRLRGRGVAPHGEQPGPLQDVRPQRRSAPAPRAGPAPGPARCSPRPSGAGGTRTSAGRRRSAGPAAASPCCTHQARAARRLSCSASRQAVPAGLLRPQQLRRRPLGQVEVVAGVGWRGRRPASRSAPGARRRTGAPSPAAGSAHAAPSPPARRSADGAPLQQAVAPRLHLRLHQGLVHQGGEEVQDVGRAGGRPPSSGRPATASAASSVQPPAKTARRRKRACSAAGEQVVAPVQGGPQRLLAPAGGAGAAGEQGQAVVQAGGHLLRGQDAGPGGGQLDGQGQPVQAAGRPAPRPRRSPAVTAKSGRTARARSTNRRTAG